MLTKSQMEHRLLREPDDQKRLVISPLLDINDQLGGNSIDVRLGTRFITHRRANISNIDPNDQELGQRLYVVKTSGTKGEPLKRATWTLTGSGSSQICQPPFG